MKRLLYILMVMLAVPVQHASAQADRSDVRKGNRDFRREEWREAEIDYRKALVKDSTSVHANYNLAAALYREGDTAQAQKVLEGCREMASMSAGASDYFYNLGNAALANKDYKTAVESYAQSLLRNPSDLSAKENYLYAKEKLKDQQQNQQNQDGQNNQQNDDDQNKQNQKDQEKEQDKQDEKQNDDKQDDRRDKPQEKQDQEPKITPQAAQQMLQAIQEKEKETQDKVKKEKAKALKSRQKDKNW